MSFLPKRRLPLAILAVVALAASLFVMFQAPKRPKPAPPPPAPPDLSVLSPRPDWPALEAFQETISRAEFEELLTQVFTTGDAWRRFIAVDDAGAGIATDGPGGETFRLRFAKAGAETNAPRAWRTAAELPPAPAGKPLGGMKIAIDPGHIGGAWAVMEERDFEVAGGTPVREGDMTLLVAKLLKPKLEALGADVSLVRKTTEPVTKLRPDDLLDFARKSAAAGDSDDAIRKTAERLFYRTAEIHARADLVNAELKPDLVLCLHFNAEPWGAPGHPILIDRTHLHLLLNGGYTDAEVALPDQRFGLLEKLLQRTHREETRVGATVAEVFAKRSGLPPYSYPPGSDNVRAIPGQPYLWARNLLANRLYDCPVIFLEPYVMNSTIDYPRFQAGDYEGLREVAGKMQPSIFREYADAVAAGLAAHYAAARK